LKNNKKVYLGTLVSILFTLLISILYLFGAFAKLQHASSDYLRVGFTKKPDASSIVYLLITDASLIEADEVDGIQWPWPRTAYGEAVKFLERSGAKVIGFDMIFSETSSAGGEDDIGFAETLKSGNIVLANLSTDNIGNSSKEKEIKNKNKMNRFALTVEDEGFSGTLKEYPYFRPPVDKIFSSISMLGDVKFLSDSDGIGRRVALIFKSGGKYFPSFSLAIAMKAIGANKVILKGSNIILEGGAVKRIIPVDADGMTWLKYYGNSSVYNKYLLLRVIKSEVIISEGGKPYYDPSLFKDKVVIIGSDATELKDLRPNPFNTKNDAGLHYHGTAVDNIINGDILRSYITPFYVITIAFLLSIITAYATASLTALFGLIGAVFLVALEVGTAVYLFRFANIIVDIPVACSAIVGSFSLTTITNYLFEAEQKTFITGAFGQYLSPKIIDELIKNPDKLSLGGEERVMTAYFSDIAGFSTISESLTPQELVALLNEYLSEMCDIIGKHEGTVDKFEGDAIIAFWGAPIPTDKHAVLACRATVEMQARLVELRKKWKEEGQSKVMVRMGLNTGPMVVGNMGSKTRMDYTMMGDAVNLAARLEGANKFYGTYTMVSQSTWDDVKDEFDGRELDIIRVVGKNEPVRVYELIAVKGEISEETRKGLEIYGNALTLYRDKKFAEAKKLFNEVEKFIPNDPPSNEYNARCDSMIENDPGDDWDGVHTHTQKG